MLSDILQSLARSKTMSLTQLAQDLGFSIRELTVALEQLERMGYIKQESLSQNCGSDCGKGSCHPSASACQGCSHAGQLVSWVLTQRGKTFCQP